MSLNSSSSNASLHPPPPSLSTPEFIYSCLNSTTGVFIITTFTIISILLFIPLCIFILYLGYQRWRQQRSDTTMSHSDVFTYNIVISELLSVFVYTLVCVGILVDLPDMVILCVLLWSFNFYGQASIHTLASVERYLAVVHPVTYLGLKNANWIRIRNITVCCVWLVCVALTGFAAVVNNTLMTIVSLCYVSFAIIAICFCSMSVLCTLIRPGPGEGGGDRQRIDQSKLRAFYTILAILGGLMLRFGASITSFAVLNSSQLKETAGCSVWLSILWFSLPGRLVLPLLFLHRAGKLPCCKNSNNTGQ